MRFFKPYIYCLLSVFLLATSYTHSSETRHFNSGFIDLSDHNFEKDGVVKIKGEWRFKWQEYYDPSNSEENPLVDEGWENYLVTGKNSGWNGKYSGVQHPPFGFGTFYGKIILSSERPSKISLYFRKIFTSCRIYINKVLVEKKGNPGIDKESTEHGQCPVTIDLSLKDKNKEIEIVIHVANYIFKRGGMDKPILVGEKSIINETIDKRNFLAIFFSGSLFFIALYNALFFIIKPKEIGTLYISLFCIAMGIRTIETGVNYLTYLFQPPPSLMISIELWAGSFGAPIFHLILREIYPNEFNKNFLYPSIIMIFISWILLLFSSLHFFSLALSAVQIYFVLMFMHVFWVSIKAIKNKRDHAILFFSSFIVVFITTTNDILQEQGLIRSEYITHYGILHFVIILSFMFLKRFTNALYQLEEHSEELENQVILRTKELSEAKDKATKLAEMNRLLNKNSADQLEKERKRISRELHDSLNASLASIKMMIIRIIRLLSTEKPIEDSPKRINDAVTLANVVLETSSECYKYAKNLTGSLRPVLIDTLGLFKAINAEVEKYSDGNLVVNFESKGDASLVPEDISMAIYRITQEAMTNIINYAQAKTAFIKLLVADGYLDLLIADDGVGFDPEHLDIPSINGGTGMLGIRERVIGMGGQCEIESGPGAGVRIKISIPI